MKNSQLDKTASVTLKYLLHLLGIALFFGILSYSMLHFWLPFLILNFSKIYYSTGSISAFNLELAVLLIIYSLFCYFANNFILNLYAKGKTLQLVLSYLVDLLIVPFSVLILIIFYNKTAKVADSDTSTLYNIFVITGLLVAKVLITAYFLTKKETAKKS